MAYGAMAAPSAHPQGGVPELLHLDKPGGSVARKSLNVLAIAECVLLPWGLFVGAFYLMSFAARYQHAELVWFLILIGLCVPVVFGVRGFVALRSRSAVGGEPTWHLFLAGTCLLAWLVGVVIGNANYSTMTTYYDLTGLNFPHDVDPRDIPGTHYMDAGGIYFKEGATVNQDYALGFKDGSTYCVAPITMGDDKLATYDFWAVGVDCCVPIPPAQFWCGSTSDKSARAGLRYTDDAQKSMYKLAIQQAAAEYQIQAKNPLLFTWTSDPEEEMEAVKSGAKSLFVAWIFMYLVLQALLVAGVVFFYQRREQSW